MLGNDLYRRAAPLLVDDLVRRAPDLLVLAALEDTITGHADVVLPVPTFADSTGTYVNNEGRAQRSYRGAAAARRDAGGLALAPRPHAARRRQGGARLGRRRRRAGRARARPAAVPRRRRGRAAARLAAGRPPGGAPDPARQRTDGARRRPHRCTSRRRRPTPTRPLAFSLEGLQACESPAPLLARVWSPGWNSGNGLHKLQEEVMGPLRGGPSGVRLLDGAHAPPAAPPAGRRTCRPRRRSPAPRRVPARAGAPHLRQRRPEHALAGHRRPRPAAVRGRQRGRRSRARPRRRRPRHAVAAVDGLRHHLPRAAVAARRRGRRARRPAARALHRPARARPHARRVRPPRRSRPGEPWP